MTRSFPVQLAVAQAVLPAAMKVQLLRQLGVSFMALNASTGDLRVLLYLFLSSWIHEFTLH